MNNYFIYLNDAVHGPLSAQVIESMLRAGTILPDTPAALEGTSEWTTAELLFHHPGQHVPPSYPPGRKIGTSRSIPVRRPEPKSPWLVATAALVIVAVPAAYFLSDGSKRKNQVVTTPAKIATQVTPPSSTSDSALSTAPPTPTLDPTQELRKRAEAGDADAQYKLARTYPDSWDFSNKDNTKEVQEMIHWIKLSAKQGNPEAEYHLANCYQYGKGVTPDPAESVMWYRKAAAQGVDTACLHIGYHYMTGWGVTKDAAEAAKWFRQGAKSDVYSLLALGRLYLKGDDGLPKDLVQALMCLDLTLARGVGEQFKLEVQRDRDACAKDMTSEQIAEAKRLASEWKP